MMLKSHKHESLTTALYLGSSDSSKFHESSASQGFQAFISKNQQSNSLYASHSTKYIPSLTIKNAKSQKAQSVQSIQSQIHRVIVAVRTIYENPEDSSIDAGCSLESLYSTVEQIVLVAKHGEQLFDSVKLEMEKGVMRLSAQLRAGTSLQTDGEVAHKLSWLSLLSKAWIGWCDKTSLVSSLLTVLNQVYIAEHKHLQMVWDLGLDLFKQYVATGSEIQSRALSYIASACDSQRQVAGDQYRALHLSLLSMFSSLTLYDILEETLLASTKAYYISSSQQAVSSMSTSNYVDFARRRIDYEQSYALWMYRDEIGCKKNLDVVLFELIKSHIPSLVEGISTLLEDNNLNSLEVLYKYIEEVGELQPLRQSFAAYIRTHGESIVLDKENDDKMIERLLEYKTNIDAIVSRAFHSNTDFRQTQKESFESFVNKRENKAAELIAKFLDTRLRSGNKTMTDDEMEHVLGEALILFRYTHSKDMFEEFYKRLFAKRLLLGRSASSDAEQSMLLKLKDECGPGFTQKLETMLTDISLSEEIMGTYATTQEKSGTKQAFEMNVNVLTQAHWPTYPQKDIIIPQEMTSATDSFAQFYETRNQGRKLQWAHTLGTTSLIAHFAKAGEKELLVSTFQTVVLLLFNNVESGHKLSYDSIKSQTGLEDQELKRTLQSLACGQIPTRVLRKDPQGKEVHDTDEFMVNEHLKNDRKRIRINMIQLAETQEEQKSTVDRVMFDRELVLQATAVRILKAKKTVKHAELLQDIVQQIASRFTVDVGEIKKAFEILIDKEYMERVEGQRGMYRYLA